VGAMDISTQSTRPSAAGGRPDAVDVQPLSADERAELVRVAAQANDSAFQQTMRHERGGVAPVIISLMSLDWRARAAAQPLGVRGSRVHRSLLLWPAFAQMKTRNRAVSHTPL